MPSFHFRALRNPSCRVSCASLISLGVPLMRSVTIGQLSGSPVELSVVDQFAMPLTRATATRGSPSLSGGSWGSSYSQRSRSSCSRCWASVTTRASVALISLPMANSKARGGALRAETDGPFVSSERPILCIPLGSPHRTSTPSWHGDLHQHLSHASGGCNACPGSSTLEQRLYKPTCPPDGFARLATGCRFESGPGHHSRHPGALS